MRFLRNSVLLLAVNTMLYAQDLAADLRPKLAGKLLQLRDPEPGQHLDFDSRGESKNRKQNGLRSLDGYLLVKKVDLRGTALVIEASRQAIIWNEKLRRSELADINMTTTLSVEIPAGTSSESQFAPVFYKVFLSPAEAAKRSCSPGESQLFADIATKVRVDQDRKSDIRFGLPWMDPNPVLCFPDGERVREVGRSMQPPRAMHTVDPSYSEAARHAGVTGTTIFMVAIDENGIPTDAILVRSLDSGLNFNALDALRRWRFAPARLDGKPVACAINVEINFKLR